jgi:cyclohexyl-isocyanide hydratase
MRVGIPLYQGVDLLDVTGPHEMLSWAGLETMLVAEHPELVSCRGGVRIEPQRRFEEAPQFDILWTPGGDPVDLARLIGDPRRTYLDFLIRQAAGAQWVCSVCEGALLLAAAGLLDGYEVTTHWAFIACLTQRFPKVKVAPGFPRFWQDRNRLTGGGISSGLDQALELIRLVKDEKTAQAAQQATQYYPCPPVTSTITPSDYCPVPLATPAAKVRA